MRNYPDPLIKSILRSVKTIAMVGASGNEIRPSYFAMMYLLEQGLSHHSGQSRHGGQGNPRARASMRSLKDVPAPVDMVDIFREARYAPGIVARSARRKRPARPQSVWMQLGVVSEDAAKLAQEAGLTVIMDRCPKIEHGRFSGEIGWMGVNRRVIDNRKSLLFGKGGSLKHS